MWMLPLLEKLNIKKMHESGLKLSAQEIYNINNSSLKDAIVHFGGGCTAEIVSDKGLLFTNHHCGYGSIQALSTDEHDYLKDGYWAMNLKEELPAKGLSVTFVDKFVDVTERLNKAVAKAKNEEDYKKRWNKEVEKIKEEAVKADPTLQARVTSFYNDNMYLLITTRTFKDIRFVGAPPSSIGKFGADTDNWMWPRHTGDFSVFRIYADKNNNPAEYSEENVPYTPKQSLKISLKGVKENDFAMIIGFPGRTTRFMSSEEALETQKINNAISIYVRGEKQDIWMNDMLADPKVRIQYSSKYAGSSNGWKKWMGMNETFDKLNIVERRAAEEKAFNEWVAADPKRVEKYGTAVETINNTIKERAEYAYVYRYLSETLSAIELIRAPQRAQRGGTRQAFYKDYSASTDRKLAKRMIAIYKEKVDAKYHPAFFAEIDNKFGGSIDAFVDNLFDTSVYTSEEKYKEANKAAVAAGKDLSADPVEAIRKDLHKVSGMIMPKLLESSAKINAAKKAYVAGTLEMMGDNASYPDANSTLRIAYGSVRGYSPSDAVYFTPVSSIEGIMQKDNPEIYDYDVPQVLRDAYATKNYGRWNVNGSVPVAFIATNHTSGGNSGSPVIDGNGNLIGVNFDRVWEGTMSDVVFDPEVCRNIALDIRFALFFIDKCAGAQHLLDEMVIIK